MPVPRFVPPTAGTREPNVSVQMPGSVVEMRNHPVALSPPGLPVPLRSAVVVVSDVAAWVVAVEAAASAIEMPITRAATSAANIRRGVMHTSSKRRRV